jgi:DNA modification methylase
MLEINRIYNGDTIDEMKKIDDKSIRMVLTSPPYNASWRKDLHRYKGSGFSDNMSDEDYIKWTVDIFNEYDRILMDKGVVVYNLSYTSKNAHLPTLTVAGVIKNTNFTLADTVSWKKKNVNPMSMSPNRLTRIVELVYVFVKKDHIIDFECNKKKGKKSRTGQQYYKIYYNFIEAKNNDGSTSLSKHNATYSTDFTKFFIDLYSFEGDIVLDNFMGTGTTAIGCLELGRKFIGIELFDKYCKYSNERIDNYLRTGELNIKKTDLILDDE